MLVDINSYKTLYYPLTINFHKCSVSCTTSDDPYAQTYALNKIEDSNVKVFNVGGKWSKILSSSLIVWVNMDWMKILITQSKNGIMINVSTSVKNRFCKGDYILNPSTCNCECKKACKIGEYLDIKSCSCKKHPVGKVVSTCEDGILNIKYY